ncbi:inorganic diphosphatase [Rhodothermus marinus]|uniref:inorganic diphosphatase n=1 Tax=Rhodothermus marinus TaxID=29549 RepID=UPI0012BA404F|nr:inorganic diphosphatase [Rhodothermus marinus]BBM73653.1 hypothetical protein RmaAA338_25180 [Rhodothermus marinus]
MAKSFTGMLPTAYSPAFLELFARSLHWEAWEQLIRQNGWTIDRPYRSRHPLFPEIIYPIDYGYINGTRSSDGEPVDLFVGRGHRGLVGAILTIDRRRSKREVKFLYNCTAEEVYLVNGFINFDRRLLEGFLVLRYPMSSLWSDSG